MTNRRTAAIAVFCLSLLAVAPLTDAEPDDPTPAWQQRLTQAESQLRQLSPGDPTGRERLAADLARLRPDVAAWLASYPPAQQPGQKWLENPGTGVGSRNWRTKSGACGSVTYGSRRLEAGKAPPSVPIMLAFEENGQPLEKARFEPTTGRLVGEGPLRVMVPQHTISPPDLSQFADPSCARKVAAECRFHEEYEHNGGASSYAIVAVRVKPLRKGPRDVDWQSAATRSLANEDVVFFGALKSR